MKGSRVVDTITATKRDHVDQLIKVTGSSEYVSKRNFIFLIKRKY